MTNPKFNPIMDESDDRAVCISVEKPISHEGYTENFLPRLDDMIQKHGEARVLVHFKEYKGWEENAAMEDMVAFLNYGQRVRKIALVNAPETKKRHLQLAKTLIAGDVEFFDTEHLPNAIDWVKA